MCRARQKAVWPVPLRELPYHQRSHRLPAAGCRHRRRSPAHSGRESSQSMGGRRTGPRDPAGRWQYPLHYPANSFWQVRTCSSQPGLVFKTPLRGVFSLDNVMVAGRDAAIIMTNSHPLLQEIPARSVTEVSVAELRAALESGRTTAVELVEPIRPGSPPMTARDINPPQCRRCPNPDALKGPGRPCPRRYGKPWAARRHPHRQRQLSGQGADHRLQ